MYNIGDLVIYSAHGICKINDICDKTVAGITKSYYVLHPMDNKHHLTISIPVNNDKVAILDLIQKESNPKRYWNLLTVQGLNGLTNLTFACKYTLRF